MLKFRNLEIKIVMSHSKLLLTREASCRSNFNLPQPMKRKTYL